MFTLYIIYSRFYNTSKYTNKLITGTTLFYVFNLLYGKISLGTLT